MITPDAKCIVNGEKVNESINEINKLLNMSIMVGASETPQIKYGSGSVQIVLPPGGGADTNERLDVVDANNTAAQRWFLTTAAAGAGGAGAGGANDGAPQNNAQNAQENKKRNQLNANGAQGAGGGGAGAPGSNRNKLQNGGAPGAAGDAGRNGTTSGKFGPNYKSTDDMAGRRNAGKKRSGKFNNSTEKFIMDGNTKKRQAAADKMHADNQMRDVAAGRATLTKDGIVSNQKPSGQSVDQKMHAKRQAAADKVAQDNAMIWKHGATGSKKHSDYSRSNRK